MLPISLNFLPMSSRVPTRQVATRARNKTAHPGLADRAKMRRTRAEAEELHKNKAQAKAAREEARQESIRRTAAFEVQDKADEDFANATPRPLFTPKQVPQPQNQAYPGLSPLPATSDAEQSDIDRPMFVPINEDSAGEDDPTERDATADDPVESSRTEDDETSEQDELIEENVPSPPPSRLKSQRTGKAAAVTTKATARRQKQIFDLESDVEMMPPPPKTQSRRKTKKGMLRADINMAAMKIREDKDRVMLQGGKDVEGGLEREADIVSFDSPDFILIYR